MNPSSDSRDKSVVPADLEERFIFVSRKLVMYPDLNAHGRLFGGQLMSWLDEGAAQVAMRIMNTTNIVTKKFGEIVFQNPGRLGDSVEIWCREEKRGRSSLTLDCRLLVRGWEPSERHVICHSTVVYVALDERGRPTPWTGDASSSG